MKATASAGLTNGGAAEAAVAKQSKSPVRRERRIMSF
jgi:hypothetical protein